MDQAITAHVLLRAAVERRLHSRNERPMRAREAPVCQHFFCSTSDTANGRGVRQGTTHAPPTRTETAAGVHGMYRTGIPKCGRNWVRAHLGVLAGASLLRPDAEQPRRSGAARAAPAIAHPPPSSSTGLSRGSGALSKPLCPLLSRDTRTRPCSPRIDGRVLCAPGPPGGPYSEGIQTPARSVLASRRPPSAPASSPSLKARMAAAHYAPRGPSWTHSN